MSEWYANIQGNQQGPVPVEELIAWARNGTLHPNDWVFPPGAAEWVAAETVPELAAGFQTANPPAAEAGVPAAKKLVLKKVEAPASAQASPVQAAAGGLQFDRAEGIQPAAGGTACTACKQGISQTYYEVNGQVVCPACHEQAKAGQAVGSGFLRFVKACLFGGVAAVVSAAIWFGITKVTGYELGIVAIGVGILVGGAVKVGGGGVGGWLYQLMAVFLTYSAIVAAHVTLEIVELSKAAPAEAGTPAPVAAAGEATTTNRVASAEQGDGDSSSFNEAVRGQKGFAVMAVSCVVLFVVGFVALPFAAGIISDLIFAFALYEAWKINTRTALEISGPYTVGAPKGIAGPAA